MTMPSHNAIIVAAPDDVNR